MEPPWKGTPLFIPDDTFRRFVYSGALLANKASSNEARPLGEREQQVIVESRLAIWECSPLMVLPIVKHMT
jgi:hypothetical protein